ncbi:MAG: carboxyl transferase [Desulfobacterales bacterium]|nr:carboxyl transferase [Desulfobacterales bacterium]
MSWENEVKEIQYRRELALRLGGEERVKKHKEQRKLTIRERIDHLLDPRSFLEIGQLTGDSVWDKAKFQSITPAPYVMGLGKIDGRWIALGGEDFTVRGGSSAGLARRKGGQGGFVEDLAKEYRIPLVNLIDGVGANVASAIKSKFKRLPAKDGYERSLELLGMVPVISAVLGSTAGGPAGRAVLSHFSVMVRGSSQLFAAGPPVVERALSRKVNKEELGGAHIACDTAGTIHNAVNSEEEAFGQIRKYLSYLPQNVWQMPPFVDTGDSPDRVEDELLSIVPRNRKQPYNMHRVIELVFDNGTFFEIQPTWGIGMIVGFARIGGYPVGIIANNPSHNAGAPDAQDSRKMGHFTSVCDQFHIPLIHFVDVPGFMIGVEAEEMGTLKDGMSAMCRVMQAKVPRISVITRKCYGMAGALNYGNHTLHYRIAWPSAEFGSIPIEGGVAAAFKREIEQSPNPAERRKEIEEEIHSFESPFRTAEKFAVEDIIDPRETRYRLFCLVEAAQNYLQTELGPKPRYGTWP